MCVKDKIENKLNEIAERSNGVITAEVLAGNGFSKYFIRKLEKNGSIYKYHHGIYMADGFLPDDYYLFQNIYKDTVFSFGTAMYLHGFSKRTPEAFDITVYSGYGTRDFDYPVNVHYVKKEFLGLGKTVVTTSYGNSVYCYDLERIFCDLCRFTDTGVDKEESNRFMKKVIADGLIDPGRLFDYAGKLNCMRKVRNVTEVLI